MRDERREILERLVALGKLERHSRQALFGRTPPDDRRQRNQRRFDLRVQTATVHDEHTGKPERQAVVSTASDPIDSNELVLGRRRVDLREITMPVLNIYATGDTIIPVACSKGMGEHFGTRDYTELAVPGGHIGTFVGNKAQKILAPTLADWFKSRSA